MDISTAHFAYKHQDKQLCAAAYTHTAAAWTLVSHCDRRFCSDRVGVLCTVGCAPEQMELLTPASCCACSLSAIIDNQIFCVHGGLSPTINTLDQVRGQSQASVL
jgi:hypothetical protein